MAAKAAKKQEEKNAPNTVATPVIAKSDDGTIELTLTFPWSEVEKALEHSLTHLAEDVTVPGFRKGTAPMDIVRTHVSKEKLMNNALQHMLPEKYAQLIDENKLTPITYPKFELISVTDGEDWQIRAITCELIPFELGDYKKVVKDALSTGSIWTPEKGGEKDASMTAEQKEQLVIKTLLDAISVKIPRVLMAEEVDSRLSSLLSRIEKLGLTLESYLTSQKKTVQDLREEYAVHAKETLSLEIILNTIAQDLNVTVDEKEVDAFIAATQGDSALHEKLSNPEQKSIISSILKKRKAIELLMDLA